MKFVLVFLLFFTSCFGLTAQEVTFERITTQQGLSQNDILSIFQDSQGFLWFGTHDGLNRYDGYEFKIFRLSNAGGTQLSSNLIGDIAEDENSNLWIGTQNAGITIYNLLSEDFSYLTNTSEKPDLLTDNRINDIYCDSQNHIWALTDDGINFIYTDENGQFNIIQVDGESDPNHDVSTWNSRDIIQMDNGDFLYVSHTGVFKIITDEHGKPTGLISNLFSSQLVKDYQTIVEKNGKLILGAGTGIYILNYDTETDIISIESQVSKRNSACFAFDSDGNIWSGGINGLEYLQYFPESKIPYVSVKNYGSDNSESGLSNEFIRDIYIDNSQILWVGTTGGGVNKYDAYKRQFRKYNSSKVKGSISHNKVTTVHEDLKGNIWFGTQGGGVSLLSANRAKQYTSGFKSIDVNDTIYQNFVYDFLEIERNGKTHILAGTGYTSLFVELLYNGAKGSVKSIEHSMKGSVLSMCEDENGIIWLGTYNDGLYRAEFTNGQFNYTHFTTENSTISSEIIRSIIEDSKGNLWFGTGEGLMMLNTLEKEKRAPVFKIYKKEIGNDKSISHNYILPITETSKGEIWIGTLGGGVNVFYGDSNDEFKHIGLKEGLPNLVIKQILEDKSGVIWISSNKGISRFNPMDSSIRNYGMKDGLQDNEFADLSGTVLSDGEILFGGVNGFNAFYPEEITEDTVAPIVVFTSFDLMNTELKVGEERHGRVILSKSVNSTERLVLKYKENNFTIHFSALQFSVPGSNQYKYKLEGFDEEWVRTTATARFAKYTNLSPGKYVFYVLASNGDGKWVEEPKSISVIVKAPLWHVAWFRFLVAFFIFITAIVVYKIRVRSIKLQNKHLEETVNIRTVELTKKNELLSDANTQLEEQKEEITTQKEEIEGHRNNLESLVKDRTVKLENALLKAKESDALKSAFLTNISHEVRTPMNAIMGFSNFLCESDLSEEKRLQYYDVIQENVSSLLKIIDSTLDLSLLESNQFKVSNSEFNLNDLVVGLYSDYKRNNVNTQINLSLNNELVNQNLVLLCDDIRLRQIVSNFMDNALKFTVEGTVELGATMENNDLSIYVKDTGRGIAQDKMGHVFEQFTKIEDDKFDWVQGIGLGLPVSQKIANAMGGIITVTSNVNVGSRFTFNIPLNKVLAKTVAKVKESEKPEEAINWNEKTILVAEDVKANSMYLGMILEKTPLNVLWAENGKEALDIVKSKSNIDLVLMDLKMPVMDGYEAAKQIKQLKPELNIVAQTAYVRSNGRAKFRDAYFADYIAKPIKEEDLLVLIGKYI